MIDYLLLSGIQPRTLLPAQSEAACTVALRCADDLQDLGGPDELRSAMASRRAYIRDERRSISSPSDDEDPDEERQNEDRARLPTLRSMIVRVNPDRLDERDDGDGQESPAPPALETPPRRRDEGAETNQRTYSHATSRSEENQRRVDSDHNSGLAYGLAMSQKNAKGLEADNTRGNFRSRGDRERMGGRERDGRHDSSNPAEKDGVGGRRAPAGLRVRDFENDDRNRAVQRRDHQSRSPPRRPQHYSRSPRQRRREADESRDSLRRGDGKKREKDRSPDGEDEQHGGKYDDADAGKFENDAKGKAKDHREGFRREAGRGHPAHRNPRRDRDASPISGDRRDAGGGSGSPLPGSRSNRGGRNGVDWGRGRERDDGRDDGRGGRRESDGVRDGRGRGGRGGRGEDAGETLVPELYSIHRATVHSIRPFGIFVQMDGYRNHGMVHLTQISNHEVTDRKDSDEEKVKAISSVVGEGEQVWVKVISVQHDEDGGKVKVGCSLKSVSQGDGKDLDPNHLHLEKHQAKAPWQGPKKLELDAVYNVSCTRCGGHGHLKKECYSSGEKTYELLEDEETDEDDGAGGSKAVAASVVPKKLAPPVGPSSKPPSGPAGRGRAMVRPAWMTHGVGVGGDQEKVLGSHSSKGMPKLPEKVSSVEEAIAVIEMANEEKRKRRLERRHRKHRKGDKKHSSKEGRKEKHKKRHRSEDDHHHRNKKKRRL